MTPFCSRLHVFPPTDVVLEVLLHHEEQLTMEVGIRWNAQFLNTLPDRPSVWLITGCKHISIWTLCLK